MNISLSLSLFLSDRRPSMDNTPSHSDAPYLILGPAVLRFLCFLGHSDEGSYRSRARRQTYSGKLYLLCAAQPSERL